MIITTLNLKEKYKDYTDINGKIKRDIDKGFLFPLVRGIYETNESVDEFLLASYIYGPSYLSFEYALSYHNLIPERVVVFTSATFNKRKSKVYQNYFGHYTYRDVPNAAFPFSVKVYEENGYAYFIARPEKALCDLLYTRKPVTSIKELKMVLFEDLRINKDMFEQLNFDEILFLSDKYVSSNMKYLRKYIESEYMK
ncbi:MAG: type IV toxin-antitoxin system AbiEi family antitoxin domain-containing protein [Candidatus Izemoplasmataceae bacterium]